MRLKTTAAALTTAILLAGCTTDGPGVPGMNDNDRDLLVNYGVDSVKRMIPTGCANADSPAMTAASAAFGGLCQGVDVLAKLTLTPAQSNSVDYSESPNFDRDLHRALKAKHETVSVDIEGAALSREDLAVETLGYQGTHMANWLAKLQGQEGSRIIACQESVPESMFLLNWLVGAVVRVADEWVTYRPLKAYDEAVIVYSPEGNDVVAKSVTFHLADGVPAECPAGTLPLPDGDA
jgi:hypothetical protein